MHGCVCVCVESKTRESSALPVGQAAKVSSRSFSFSLLLKQGQKVKEENQMSPTLTGTIAFQLAQ